MPSYNAAAAARHDYLLSRFKTFPLPSSNRVEHRFVGNLARAVDIREAVDAAMKEEGLTIPDGYVELTPKQVHQMKYLLGLFVKAAPETVPALDGGKLTDVLYSFGMTRNFSSQPTSPIAAVLEYYAQYRAPAEISGLRTDRDSLYENLHIALRKLCDSKITSAAWNAMHVIDADARDWLCTIVHAALTAKAYDTAEAVTKAVTEAFLKDDTYQRKPNRALMHCLFQQFSDEDWSGMLSYCIIRPDEVKNEAEVGA